MGIAKLYGQKSSGININGIIEDYYVYAGEKVSAGDLVEYINGISGVTHKTNSPKSTSYEPHSYASACAIDEETVLIAIPNGADFGDLIVAKINEATINLGTALRISDASTVFEGAIKVDTNRAVVFYKSGGSSGHYMYIVKINGTTPIATYVNLGGSRGNSMEPDSYCLLGTNKIMCTYNKDNRYSTQYLRVITITSDTSATLGTEVSDTATHLALYTTNQVFCGKNSTFYFATIDGSTITVSPSKTSTSADIYSCTQLTDKTVLMSLFDIDSSSIYACCVYRDGILSDSVSFPSTIRGVLTKINSTTAFVIDYNDDYSSVIKLNSNNTLTIGTAFMLDSSTTFEDGFGITTLNDHTVFGIYKNTSSDRYMIRLFGIDDLVISSSITTKSYEKQVRKTTTSQFDGVAKTSGTGGTDTAHNEQVKIARSSITPTYKVYTAIIDLSNSNPETSVTYADDAVGMTPGSDEWDNFFGHYPVVLSEGAEVGKINRNNFKQFEDGSAITEGDVMIAFPRRGLTIKTENNKIYISMTDNPNDSNFEYNAHTRGTAWRDKFYLGAYKASKLEGKLRSYPSATGPLINETIGACRNYAHANGAGYELSGFYQLTFRQCMYILKYKNLDSQTAVGRGYVSASKSTNTHGTDTLGMDYGTTSGTTQMKLFGIEDFWGNVYEYIDGIYCDSNWHILTGNDNFNDTGSGYYDNGQCATTNIYGNILIPQGSTKTGFIIKTTDNNTSYNTAFCDYGTLYAGRLACFGGSWANDSNAGAFQLNVDYSASDSSSYIGARLMFL